MGKAIQSRREVRAEARRKGVHAGAAAAATVVATAVFGFFPLGVAGVAVTGVLGWRWFRYRIKHGVRF